MSEVDVFAALQVCQACPRTRGWGVGFRSCRRGEPHTTLGSTGTTARNHERCRSNPVVAKLGRGWCPDHAGNQVEGLGI